MVTICHSLEFLGPHAVGAFYSSLYFSCFVVVVVVGSSCITISSGLMFVSSVSSTWIAESFLL